MQDKNLLYQIPGANWSLKFPEDAVKSLTSHAQRHRWSKESVGQIYSDDLCTNTISVNAVTKLRSKWSSHTGVRLNIPSIAQERVEFFAKGMHCLGFWHTHPEPSPTPSQEDIEMAADHARAGLNVFTGIVFVIVGTAPPPMGIGVWVHDGTTLWHAVSLKQ
jgi:proteasome lid subunit RPN8/RPN11